MTARLTVRQNVPCGPTSLNRADSNTNPIQNAVPPTSARQEVKNPRSSRYLLKLWNWSGNLPPAHDNVDQTVHRRSADAAPQLLGILRRNGLADFPPKRTGISGSIVSGDRQTNRSAGFESVDQLKAS